MSRYGRRQSRKKVEKIYFLFHLKVISVIKWCNEIDFLSSKLRASQYLSINLLLFLSCIQRRVFMWFLVCDCDVRSRFGLVLVAGFDFKCDLTNFFEIFCVSWCKNLNPTKPLKILWTENPKIWILQIRYYFIVLKQLKMRFNLKNRRQLSKMKFITV